MAANKPKHIPDEAKFIDFAPDLDHATPGILTDCANVYPTQRGYRSYPALEPYTAALPAAALGAFSSYIGSTDVIFAGTITQLYILTGLTWTTQALPLTTMSAADDRWRSDAYGNVIIAVNGIDPPQSYAGSGTFAALAGSPPVASIVAASDFSLFLIEKNSNKWWSSLSATLWTPSIATQTVTDNLDETAGNIVGAHRLRAGMALYKNSSFSYALFEGPPFYWKFVTISREVGAPSHEAVANLGDIHYWPGNADFYSFDGYTLSVLPNQLKEWFYSTLDGQYAHKICARWDRERSLVFWHFPTRSASPAGSLNAWVCFSPKYGKWSCHVDSDILDVPLFSAVRTGALTYAAIGALYPLYSSFSGMIYGDLRSRSIDHSAGVRAVDHKLALFNGDPGEASVTTHDWGDYANVWNMTRLKPSFHLLPALGAQVWPITQAVTGGARVTLPPTTITPDGNFDLRVSARMQRDKIVFNSDAEIIGVKAEIGYAGSR